MALGSLLVESKKSRPGQCSELFCQCTCRVSFLRMELLDAAYNRPPL